MLKLKTYILVLSKNYLAHHEKKGQPTHFKEKYLEGKKKHTIRGNYELWKKRIDEVNRGEAVLKLVEWSGKPYNSKQVTIDILKKAGYEKIKLKEKDDKQYRRMKVGKYELGLYETFDLVTNDGFGEEGKRDCQEWVRIDWLYNWIFKKKSQKVFNGIIIHFTDLRYEIQNK